MFFLFFLTVGCSHQRAWEYFVESVGQPRGFPAQRCEPSEMFGICREPGGGPAFMGMGADPRWVGKSLNLCKSSWWARLQDSWQILSGYERCQAIWAEQPAEGNCLAGSSAAHCLQIAT